MDVFVAYESDYEELRDSIGQRLETLKRARGDEKRKEIQQAKDELEEAQSIVESMDLTAKSRADARLTARVAAAEEALSGLRAELRRAEAAYGAAGDRERLLEGGVASDLAVTSADQREQMLAATERLEATGDIIKHAMRTATEAEQMGVATLGQLHGQRERIEASRDRLGTVDDALRRAQRIMRGISRRVMTNKLISMFIVLLLLFGIVLVIYLGFMGGGEPSPPTPSPTPPPPPPPPTPIPQQPLPQQQQQ